MAAISLDQSLEEVIIVVGKDKTATLLMKFKGQGWAGLTVHDSLDPHWQREFEANSQLFSMGLHQNSLDWGQGRKADRPTLTWNAGSWAPCILRLVEEMRKSL